MRERHEGLETLLASTENRGCMYSTLAVSVALFRLVD